MIDSNWSRWHNHYDRPGSELAQRLAATQIGLRIALAQAPSGENAVVQLVSICAGEGREVLPVLAAADHGRIVKALLLEMDPAVAEKARRNIARLKLLDVELRAADAGTIDSFADVLPAHVVVASGVFGNISMDDTRRTIAALQTVLAPGGLVVWTRSRRLDGTDLSLEGTDRSLEVRTVFLDHRFSEVAFNTIPDGTTRIGVHKRASEIASAPALQGERRMFRFRASSGTRINQPRSSE